MKKTDTFIYLASIIKCLLFILSKKYFIQQYSFFEHPHGWISHADAEKIFIEKGFQPLVFPYKDSFSLTAKFARFFALMRFLFNIPNGSAIIFLFPVFARMNQLLLKLIAFKKNIKLICMIGDIEGLRDNDQALLAAETKEFKSYNYFIVHNQRMADWLKKITPHCTLTNIDFFDYLVNSVTTERKLLPEIAFAGNLKKSSFLSELHLLSGKKPELHFILYGPGITEEIKSYQNVTYFGIFKPYEMPSKIEGSFGLIWDGVSIDTCSGSYGDYLRINTQHKLSLYIVSGLPVIVWEEAATAAFVKQYKIGITIKSLYEISDKIKSISFADYVTMRKNMMPIADKIRRGFYLSNALENLMEF